MVCLIVSKNAPVLPYMIGAFSYVETPLSLLCNQYSHMTTWLNFSCRTSLCIMMPEIPRVQKTHQGGAHPATAIASKDCSDGKVLHPYWKMRVQTALCRHTFPHASDALLSGKKSDRRASGGKRIRVVHGLSVRSLFGGGNNAQFPEPDVALMRNNLFHDARFRPRGMVFLASRGNALIMSPAQCLYPVGPGPFCGC